LMVPVRKPSISRKGSVRRVRFMTRCRNGQTPGIFL
jgi:hypothetical protein